MHGSLCFPEYSSAFDSFGGILWTLPAEGGAGSSAELDRSPATAARMPVWIDGSSIVPAHCDYPSRRTRCSMAIELARVAGRGATCMPRHWGIVDGGRTLRLTSLPANWIPIERAKSRARCVTVSRIFIAPGCILTAESVYMNVLQRYVSSSLYIDEEKPLCFFRYLTVS